MERWSGKVAMVTGASAGIGAAICKALVENGVKVVGMARRLEKMKEMQKHWSPRCAGLFYPIQCDLRKEDDILRAFAWVKQNLGGVDILVNNAGVAVDGSILGGTTESYRKILETNTIAPAICTREAVKSMNERKVPGHVININSILGQQHTHEARNPVCFYAPSKHALTSMSRVFQNEIDAANLNIKVTNMSPGLVKTEIAETLGRPDIYERYSYIEAKDIADAAVYVLSTPPSVVIPELTIVPATCSDRMQFRG